MVLDGKSSQENWVNAWVPQGSILYSRLFLLYIKDLSNDVICNIARYTNDTLSTLSVIRHLNCGNYQNWLLNLNLIYETLWAGAWSGFLISVMEKHNWFNLTGLITLMLLMWKWMGLFLRKNHLLRLSLLLKLPTRTFEPWFILWSLLLLRLLCISIYLWFGRAWNTGDVWAGAPSCYLEFLDKLQKQICRTFGPSLAA